MELAFGVLNMSPDDFWNQTMMEWQARVRGFQKSKGGKEDKQPKFSNLKEAAKYHNEQLKRAR